MNKSKYLLLSLAIIVTAVTICSHASADTVYTWTDKEGTVHITNMPPPAVDGVKAENITLPTDTVEAQMFRMKQNAAMDRMKSNFDAIDLQRIQNEQRAETESRLKEFRQGMAESKNDRAKDRIRFLEDQNKRYQLYRDEAHRNSTRQWYSDQMKYNDEEIRRQRSKLNQ